MTLNTTLRGQRTKATRDYILNAAFDLLINHPELPLSHEAVAKAGGIGSRTVYRYFPAQADLFEAMWQKVRERSGTVFPTAEAEIIPKIAVMFRAFDENEKLVRAVMESAAGARVRAQGAAEGRASFDQSLNGVTRGFSSVERRQMRSVFQCIHSGPFWQMLHDRGELNAPEAIAAASWAAQVLLDALRHRQRNSRSNANHSSKKGNHRNDNH
jgi:AcrR family transcriptional regulator